jgi:DNA modification methylase
MNTELVPINDLTPDPANARKHGERNLSSIIDSLRAFGQQKPIVVDRRGVVIAGNGTLEAAKRLGWEEIAVVRTELDPTQATAFGIADNRTAELAEWDEDVLVSLLDSLDDETRDLLHFDEKELEAMVPKATVEVVEDEVPEKVEPVTKPGDLWLLGDHRLLCGDSTKAEDVERLMDGEKADLCFTSPPYGQQRDYTEEGKAKVSDWDGLMRGVFANLPMADAGQVLVNLGMIHRDGEWIPYWDGWISWMREQGWRRFGWYVWDQGSGLPGDWNGRFAPSHEFIWHFNRTSIEPEKFISKKPENVKARNKGGSTMRGKDGKCVEFTSPESSAQPNKIPDSVVRINRMHGGHGIDHPAIFPVELPAFAMQAWPGTAYEPFCGSGTTLIAAEQLGRKCYGMEISPQYCDVIVRRWENLTGETAVLADA